MNTAIWIVAIVMLAGVCKHWLDSRKNGAWQQKSQQHEEQLRHLRERIEALEAILTDPAFHLRRDIDKLNH